MRTVTFHEGQQVYWPTADHGVAQIAEILRSNLILAYYRGARLCRPVLPAVKIAEVQEQDPRLPNFAREDNPLRRANRRRKAKTFALARLSQFERKWALRRRYFRDGRLPAGITLRRTLWWRPTLLKCRP